MIVRPRPRLLHLFFIMRGSIVPRIAPQILGFAAYASLVVVLTRALDVDLGSIGLGPFALFGITLSIYLGFRNNAAYDRWWEARKLWGQLVYEIRNLARAGLSAVPDRPDLFRPTLMDAVAFCHLLRGDLRSIDTVQDVRPFIGAQADELVAAVNKPDAIIRHMGREVGRLRASGDLQPVDYRIIDEHMSSMAALQAGCERIANTPVPFAYTLLLHRSAYLYCALLPFGLAPGAGWATPLFTAVVAYSFFGLDALSEELEDPFGIEPNDLALDSLCRVCEISVCEALGEPAPPMLVADHYNLS
ncbi:MAG: putative rane protein [Ilumatobacteraceae bacterium]|nr:putative rane protein [Ilumatobacteraceae bacterium]